MDTQITEQELAICRQIGISSEEYLKTREAEKKNNPEGGNQLNGQITREEIAVCRQMGVDPKDYLKTREGERLKALCQEDGLTVEAAMEKVMQFMGISPGDMKKYEEQGRLRADALVLSDAEIEACRRLGIVPSEYEAHKRIAAGMVFGAKLNNKGEVIWE